MIEIDRDGSDTIDFYEYLQVADMLIEKRGDYAILNYK